MGKPRALLSTTRVPRDVDVTYYSIVNAYTSFPTLNML
jgi:hypothetical protein